MKEINFHDLAKVELEEAFDYYEARREGLGDEFRAEIDSALIAIQRSPKAFPFFRTAFRKFFVNRFPYKIYYLELTELIWITAVSHDRRREGYWISRTRDIPN